MTVEHARRRELAELVADHVLADIHRNVLLSVVDAERQANELGQDRRATAPGLDDLVAARRAHLLSLLENVAVYERAFPNCACHSLVSSVVSARCLRSVIAITCSSSGF